METSVANVLPCSWLCALRPATGPDQKTGQGPPRIRRGRIAEKRRIEPRDERAQAPFERRTGRLSRGRPVRIQDWAGPPEVWEGDRPTQITGETRKLCSAKRKNRARKSKEAV